MTKQLLISIITPSYNQGKFIEDTILSVKNQDYPNFEHIITDAGSTDETLSVIKKYEGTYNMRWISEPDNGPVDGLNKGFNMAKGDILAWINTDDYYEPNVFDNINRIFVANNDIDFLIGDAYFVKGDIKKILNKHRKKQVSLNELIKFGNFIDQSATFFTTRLFKKAGPLDIKLKYVFDYELWLRFFKLNPKYIYLNKPLANFKPHEGAISFDNREEVMKEMYKVGQEYSLDNKKFLPQIIKYHRAKHFVFFDKFLETTPRLYGLTKNFSYRFLDKLHRFLDKPL